MDLRIEIPDGVEMDGDTTKLFRVFLQAMANRRVVGALRYGDVPRRKQKYLTRLRAELKAYEQGGNFEQLVNIANYAFLEGAAPERGWVIFDPTAPSVTRKDQP